jgi:hypothetical protein
VGYLRVGHESFNSSRAHFIVHDNPTNDPKSADVLKSKVGVAVCRSTESTDDGGISISIDLILLKARVLCGAIVRLVVGWPDPLGLTQCIGIIAMQYHIVIYARWVVHTTLNATRESDSGINNQLNGIEVVNSLSEDPVV